MVDASAGARTGPSADADEVLTRQEKMAVLRDAEGFERLAALAR